MTTVYKFLPAEQVAADDQVVTLTEDGKATSILPLAEANIPAAATMVPKSLAIHMIDVRRLIELLQEANRQGQAGGRAVYAVRHAGRGLPAGAGRRAVLRKPCAQRGPCSPLHRVAHREPSWQPGRLCAPVRDAPCAGAPELCRPAPLACHPGAGLLPGVRHGRQLPA